MAGNFCHQVVCISVPVYHGMGCFPIFACYMGFKGHICIIKRVIFRMFMDDAVYFPILGSLLAKRKAIFFRKTAVCRECLHLFVHFLGCVRGV